MKKTSVLILLTIVVVGSLTAQVEEKKAGFQLSFVPPLSTQGMQASNYTNAVSFSILGGVSKNITAFSLSGLGTYVVNEIGGVHIAGLGTYAGGKGNGFMLSGLLNRTGDFNGIAIAGLTNLAGESSGFQLGGLFNLSKGGIMHGMQLSGLANAADDVNGVQIAGLVNIAKSVKGVQLAGLINIAETSDYPIGLINIIKNGEMSVGVSYNEIGSTVAAFRSGGRILYGIAGVGYNHKSEKEQFVTEAGLGAHIPISSRFRINNEIRSQFLNDLSDWEDNMIHSSVSIMPAFKILPQWEIFGGPSINYIETNNMDNEDMFPDHSIWKKFSDDKLRQVYIGFSVGTHFLF